MLRARGSPPRAVDCGAGLSRSVTPSIGKRIQYCPVFWGEIARAGWVLFEQRLNASQILKTLRAPPRWITAASELPSSAWPQDSHSHERPSWRLRRICVWYRSWWYPPGPYDSLAVARLVLIHGGGVSRR